MTSTPGQTKNYPLVEITNENELDENNSSKKQLDLIGNNKRVIDFGCATGYFAQFLKQRGCYVVGVELNPEAAKMAEHYCDEVFVADLDFVSVPEILRDQKFEVAVFGDVLEHLRDPWRVLEETRQLLQPGGFVVASIPNIAHGAVRLSLLQGHFEYADLGLLDNTHLRFFTRKTVQELFERAGYTVDIIDRTIVPVFSGSSYYVPDVERHSLSKEIIHQVEQAEDADTLQFVLRAFPTTLEGKYAALDLKYSRVNEQNLQLQTELSNFQNYLAQTQTQLEQTKTQLDQTQNHLAQTQTQLEQTKTQLDQTQNHLAQTQTQLEQTQQRNNAVESSKFWKIRKVWVRCKQIVGLKT
jgi:2-polyprenyl-3-methyl-5-hydroxy-6-metoxy-1,4-benzoquinol methylase